MGANLTDLNSELFHLLLFSNKRSIHQKACCLKPIILELVGQIPKVYKTGLLRLCSFKKLFRQSSMAQFVVELCHQYHFEQIFLPPIKSEM